MNKKINNCSINNFFIYLKHLINMILDKIYMIDQMINSNNFVNIEYGNFDLRF